MDRMRSPRKRAAIHPTATVEWILKDVTTLTFAEAYSLADTPRLAVFVYLGVGQLARLRPLLLAIVRAGGRVVTYHNHLELTDSDGLCTLGRCGDMLMLYARDPDMDGRGTMLWDGGVIVAA